ncbi:MAG: DEAD/DEAH box helicase [Anaerolineae bacterium]|nr:DEAD/DEAH box helicase [Anaerolineae bacterium]
MSDLSDRLALKARLPRAWPAFFERHGNFTPTQLAAIPVLLDGDNVIVCAPTAGGKTEAALAPLVERHCSHRSSGLRLLYIIPTRALGNDLQMRIAPSLDVLHLSLGIKTRDLTTFDPQQPSVVLITTPESVDSLLTSHARLFTNLRGIIIDEIHLFDGTPRGDQLRVLLNRLREVRRHASQHSHAPDEIIQYAALSATVTNPAAAAARYFPDAKPIEVAGRQSVDVAYLPLSPDSVGELTSYWQTFRARDWRKAIVFCNSRSEVESYAAAVRRRSPFGSAVYVHYSNIEAQRRHEIEEQFATDEAAVCFATSTLELGIDIGSIDVVVLIGPPGDGNALVQRIGRGNRRRQQLHVACFYRTPLEEIIFKTLIANTLGDCIGDSYNGFRPSITVQQIFSYLKQSPAAALRLNTIASLFDGMLSSQEIEMIVGHLQQLGYLQPGRPGEWRAGPELNRLIDEQASDQPSLSIYSNIDVTPAQLEVRDRHTHRVIAQINRQWLHQSTLSLEGRPVNVDWVDGEAVWVTSVPAEKDTERLIYRSGRKSLSYEVAHMLPVELGLPPDTSPLVETPEGWWWFHWLGDVYGVMLFNLLRFRVSVEQTAVPGLCLRLADKPLKSFSWTETQVEGYLKEDFRRFEKMLALGAFHPFLPRDLRRRAVIEQVNVPRFLDALAALCYTTIPEDVRESLFDLLDADRD